MKKSMVAIVGFSAAALLVGTAWAGYKSNASVVVNPTARYAYGALGTARNSTDGNQEIGCNLWTEGPTASVTCWAHDAASGTNTVSCASSAAGMVQTLSAMNSDSWLYFTYDTSGNCTYLEVDNVSVYAPKGP